MRKYIYSLLFGVIVALFNLAAVSLYSDIYAYTIVMNIITFPLLFVAFERYIINLGLISKKNLLIGLSFYTPILTAMLCYYDYRQLHTYNIWHYAVYFFTMILFIGLMFYFWYLVEE